MIDKWRISQRSLWGFFVETLNPGYASECIGLICWITIQSIKGYTDAFREWLTEDLKLEANGLMPKIFGMVTRHFEVRKYDKEKMIH